MKDLFDEKTILVTGGTGSIGSCVVRELLKFNVKKIVIFSRDEIKQFIMKRMINDERIGFVIGDIRDYRSVKKLFEKNNFDIVYHAAAMKHVIVCEENPMEAVMTNVTGTQNIVDVAKEHSVRKLINISTDKAVNPNNVMGATKFIAERIAFNANYTSVRFGNVAGSRGSVIPVLIDEMVNKRRLTITEPNVTRFIMRITDAVKLVLKATEHAKGGEIFILKMKAFRLSDLVGTLITDIAPRLGIHDKIKVNVTGLVAGEKMHEELISATELPFLHELDELYVVKPSTRKTSYQKLQRSVFSSNNAEFVTKDELLKIVEEYLNLHFKEGK
jgi:FlaA1/EpsC-like NDP-sugar epimerase